VTTNENSKKLHESQLLEIQKRQFGHDETNVKLLCKFGNCMKWWWTIITQCNMMGLKSKLCISCNYFVFSLYMFHNLLPLDFIFKQNFVQKNWLFVALIIWHTTCTPKSYCLFFIFLHHLNFSFLFCLDFFLSSWRLIHKAPFFFPYMVFSIYLINWFLF
jgi:hypothetical protein